MLVGRAPDREALDGDAVRIHVEDRKRRRRRSHRDGGGAVLGADEELLVDINVLDVRIRRRR